MGAPAVTKAQTLSDAECDALISRVTGMHGERWPSYEHRLIRAGYTAGLAAAPVRSVPREPTGEDAELMRLLLRRYQDMGDSLARKAAWRIEELLAAPQVAQPVACNARDGPRYCCNALGHDGEHSFIIDDRAAPAGQTAEGRDAERYRFLRDEDTGLIDISECGDGDKWRSLRGDDLDAAVDAQRNIIAIAKGAGK